MFIQVNHISDIQSKVADKSEIRFAKQPNGIIVGCYLFSDNHTFDSPEALECRGIAFDENGAPVSRTMQKFFNAGEKEWLSLESIMQRNDIHAIYEKLDGSMIATAFHNNGLLWRSKKSFTSDVVALAIEFVNLPENSNIKTFAYEVASRGMTATFELTHPAARIVVAHERASLRLLHVRDNVSGQYVMLDANHMIHQLIAEYAVPMVPKIDITMEEVIQSLETMRDQEGYVIQFKDGDMVKIKCPWYNRLHRSITFLRERDIAQLAINEELDDVKASLVEAGIDLTLVNGVETKLKDILSGILDEVETIYQNGKDLDRKGFAIANKGNPLFGLAMQRFLGNDIRILEWYGKNRLKDDFSLRVLVDDAKAEAIEG